jgi:tetratricopeptide (TPR) repeat protein
VEQVGNQASQARVLNHLSYLQFQRGHFSSTLEVAQQALDLATAAGLPSEIATGLFNKANALRNLGHHQKAVGFYEQAIALYEELGSDHQARLADALNRMGAALMFTGACAEARSVVERSLTIRRQLGDRMGISYSLANLCVICVYQGQFARAREAAQEALELASVIGDLYGETGALDNLGDVMLEQGFPTQAIPLFQRGLRITREIGDLTTEAILLLDLGRAYHHLGDLEQAREMLEQSLDMGSVIERRLAPLIHAHLARLSLATDRDNEALAHARAGLRAAHEVEAPWPLGIAHRVLGEVAAHVGSDKVEPHFEESIRVLREIGAEAELARSLAAYGIYLNHSTDAEEMRRGAAMLEEARTLFQELGMARDLAQLEAEAPAPLPPGQISVRLPRAGAPTGRPLRDDEYVTVTWTVAVPEDEVIPRKVIRRRHCLLRLLREAADQSTTPTVPALAAALEVTPRTIERDLAALRAAGHDVRTRGSHPLVASEHNPASRD